VLRRRKVRVKGEDGCLKVDEGVETELHHLKVDSFSLIQDI
jgi:hypothetical protein